MHWSVQSVTHLPREWQNSFSYVHQRLLIAALDDLGWNKAINQFCDVLMPGGWIELVEIEAKMLRYGVGPKSEALVALITQLFNKKGVIGDPQIYLPALLAKVGFVDIHCESRDVPICQSMGDGLNRSQQWYDLWMGMKGPMVTGGGYGIVQSEKEYETLLQGCLEEWTKSDLANTTYYTIVARKPFC